jgi:hypothetical protein
LNGFYAHPDPGTCNVFYACVEGKAEEYVCSPGLWFDEYKGVCNWPAETDRQNCNAGRLSGNPHPSQIFNFIVISSFFSKNKNFQIFWHNAW